ncbi:MAG: ferritin [Desulfuromonas sp.]|nr:ferritin [Desulfuromonas sp.]
MSEEQQICLTFDAALDKAIEMEEAGFRNYLRAIRMVRNPHAREILRDAAIDELSHKQQLEKALLDGALDLQHAERPVPIMNLDYMIGKREIGPGADVREALAYAIHLEKEAVQFYRRLTEVCAGAPMVGMFTLLLNDESRHLRALEDLYEEHFLTEN